MTAMPEASCKGASNRILAILDTGASRCVMGENLLKAFLGQLDRETRKQIRVAPSSVRFRFGNNQTLLSQKRLLVPLVSPSSKILWLSLEVVPGSTPLLFSKRAIQQLGGVIDTTRDRCSLKKLGKVLTLETSPTGLYLVDLSQLCAEGRSGHVRTTGSITTSLSCMSVSALHLLIWGQDCRQCCEFNN